MERLGHLLWLLAVMALVDGCVINPVPTPGSNDETQASLDTTGGTPAMDTTIGKDGAVSLHDMVAMDTDHEGTCPCWCTTADGEVEQCGFAMAGGTCDTLADGYTACTCTCEVCEETIDDVQADGCDGECQADDMATGGDGSDQDATDAPQGDTAGAMGGTP